MGKVYKAIQSPLDRVVALKVLNPNYANGQDPGFRQRFFLEASLTSKLRHPNTITVIDYGQTNDGIFYIAMEYLEGQPLSQLLARSGPVHWTRGLQIAQQICRSLREAHKLGIIHRDLKPANVMLLIEDREDLVKVLDFGLVKSFIREGKPTNSEITNAGMFLGSPQYMAPEQARNHADPRSDVYSLGVVLYHMLVGRPPFVAKDTIDVIFKQMNEPPPAMRSVRPDIDLPKEVEALVMKCLEKQPSWRFQSMDDVLDAMRKAATAAGMGSILTDPSANGAAYTPPPMFTPQMANGADGKEATFAIDISVVSSLGKIPLLLRERKLLVAGLVLASMLIGFGGTAAILAGRGPSRSAMAAVQPPKVVVPAAPETSAPKLEDSAASAEARAPKSVKFRVSTEPQGAHVSVSGKSLGSTPIAFDVPASADGTATAELQLTLKGYHPMTVVTGGSGPEVVLSQRLQSKSSAKPSYAAADRREAAAKAAPVESEKPEEKKEEEPASPPAKSPPVDRSAASAAGAPAAGGPAAPSAASGAPAADPSTTAKFIPSFVFDAQRISSPNPHLPQAFAQAHPRQQIRGTYRICVNRDGRVSDVSVVTSIPGTDQAIAEQLKSTWTYKPQPVPICTERQFIFNIN